METQQKSEREAFVADAHNRSVLVGEGVLEPGRQHHHQTVVEDINGARHVDVKAEEVGVGPVGGLVGVGGLDRGCKTTAFRR